MKIGDAYDLNEVDPRQFEKLAGQIGFTKSPVKQRVAELAGKILQQLDVIKIEHPVEKNVRKFIHDHCTSILVQFTK